LSKRRAPSRRLKRTTKTKKRRREEPYPISANTMAIKGVSRQKEKESPRGKKPSSKKGKERNHRSWIIGEVVSERHKSQGKKATSTFLGEP